MKSSLNFFYRVMISVVIFGGMLGMVSCSGKVQEEHAAYLSVLKDGSVKSNIEESFEESYYDKDELQQTILTQVADYNRTAGGGNITVEKVDVEDGMAVVQMTYKGAGDYAAFNKVAFFVGTAKEAEEAGFDLNVVLSGVKNSNETMGKSDILATEGEKLLIMDVGEHVVLNGKALYVSDNVTVSDNGKTVWVTGEEEGPAYIIFK